MFVDFTLVKFKYVPLIFNLRTGNISVHLTLMVTCKEIPFTKSIYNIKAMKSVIQVYTKQGFKFVQKLLDGRFELLKGNQSVMGINVDILSTKIKRNISEQRNRELELHTTPTH